MSDKNVVILGLGATGLSCVAYFLDKGINPTVLDTRSNPPGADKLTAGVNLITGALSTEILIAADLIVASPGIALATPELVEAAESGVEIVGDIELFAREAKAPIVAITGSNGKSTVTSLLGEMAKADGKKVAVGGNIGIPALELLKTDAELYVLELSSFQLETTYSLKAAAATILNLSEDHMDRYASYQSYMDAKQKIYQGAGFILVNRDEPLTQPKNGVYSASFGSDAQDYGISGQGAEGYLVAHGEALIDTQALKLAGLHNQTNVLAAFALGEAVGLTRKAMLEAATAYTGLAHRCEFVTEQKGVSWINDSKATNVGATLAAIEGLAPSIEGNLYLIVGGDGKGGDFEPLRSVFAANVHSLICFGKDGDDLAQLNANSARVENLEQAVAYCARLAEQGDWVLLSPACASLDMFRNFMARGDKFKQLVEAL